MSFKQLGEIIPKVLSETLQDPEQQKRIAETIAGFVSMPDREDTSDSAFDLGRFKQINLQNERRLQNQALAAEIQREKEAADLKYRRELNLKEEEYFAKGVLARFKEGEETKRKEDEIAGRKDVENLKVREERRKEARNMLKYIDKGEGINFFTYFQQDGKGGFFPTPYFMEILQDLGHKFGSVENSKNLATNPSFQKYAKGIQNNISLSNSRKNKNSSSYEKGSAVLGGPNMQYMVNIGAVPLNKAVANVTNITKQKTNLDVVKNEASTYLLTTVEGLTTVFANDKFKNANILGGLGLKPENGISSENLLAEYETIRGLYANIQNNVLAGKVTESNESLKNLGSKLAGILERKGEADYFKEALRSSIAPKPVQDGTVSPVSKDASKGITSYQTDYSLLVQNPILKALAIEFGILTPEEIPNVLKPIQSNHSSDKTNAPPTVVYSTFPNAGIEVGNYFQNIKNQAAKFTEVDNALKASVKKLRETGFDSVSLENEASKIYSLLEKKEVRDVSPYDVLVYLHLNSVKEKEVTSGSRYTKNIDVYNIRGISKTDAEGKMSKVFRDRADIDNGLNDVMQITSRLALLNQMDPEKFIQDTPKEERKEVSMGSVASILQSVDGFRGILDEGIRALGLNTAQDNTFAKERFESFKGDLTKKNRQIMSKVQEEAERSQEEINKLYAETKKKPGGATTKDYALYVKRSTILWEKTALTYKLAGVVQGGTTGGRTISDTDFSIIYGNLWGGRFSPEIASQAAISNLRKVTLETMLQRKAESILLQATGERISGGALQQAVLNSYRNRMDKFYKNRPSLKDAVDSRTRDGSVQYKIDNGKALSFRNVYPLLNFTNKLNLSNEQILSYAEIDSAIQIGKNNNYIFTGTKGGKNFNVVKQYLTQEDSDFGDFLTMISFISDKRDTFRSQNFGNPLFEKLFDEGIQDSFVQLDTEMRNMKAQYLQYKNALDEAGNNAEAIQEIKERFSHVSIFDEIED